MLWVQQEIQYPTATPPCAIPVLYLLVDFFLSDEVQTIFANVGILR